MSNQVPTGKWNVGGWYVTCISNCVLGNSSLNAIDSWGIQHYVAHQPIPFQPHLLSDKSQNSSHLPCYQYLAPSQTSGNRNCLILTLKVGKEVNKNTFKKKKDWPWLIWQQGWKSTGMQLDAAIFQLLICVNPYEMYFPGRCQSVPVPPDAWASLTWGME